MKLQKLKKLVLAEIDDLTKEMEEDVHLLQWYIDNASRKTFKKVLEHIDEIDKEE